MLSSVLGLAHPAVKLAETEIAMGDQRTHAVLLSDYQCLPVVRSASFSVEHIGMAGEVSEQVQRMGQRARLVLRGFDRAFAEVLVLVEPLKQQAGATHRNVGPAAVTENSTCRLIRKELLGLPHP